MFTVARDNRSFVLHCRREASPPLRTAVWFRGRLRGYVWLILGLFSAAAMSLAAPASTQAVKNLPSVSNSGLVGSDACAACHAEVSKAFTANPHAHAGPTNSHPGVTCEDCHSAGKAHVDSAGDRSKIFNPAGAPPSEVDANCLRCHSTRHAGFERSAHARSGVGCTGCHSVHHAGNRPNLLKAAQPALCYGCHSDTKRQFSMLTHHNVDDGLLSCSGCHDSHEASATGAAAVLTAQNAVCARCHEQDRGPFTFEHAVVKAEGCVSCHTPHGSQNAVLLNVSNVNALCTQCHILAADSTVHGHDAASSQQARCTDCHAAIHGSNDSQFFSN